MTRLLKVVGFSMFALFASAAGAYDTEPQERRLLSQPELDQILAPIALYPDSLLSQILMAATYPQDVAEAASWSRVHPEARGDAAVRAVENEPWDPSVISLVAFPQVLAMMDERRDWTDRLGQAFIEQPDQVMDTVQQLRARADAQGNLRTSEEIVVQRQGDDYVIEPPTPEVVYVPYYDPRYVYGNWWWPGYEPIYWRPWHGYAYRPGYSGFGWGYGITIGSGFFFGALDWPHRSLRYSYHRPWYFHGRDYRRGDRWTHNRDHRDRRWRDGDAAPQWRSNDRRRDGDNRWRDGDRRRDGDRDYRRDGRRGDRPASNDPPRGTRPTYERRDVTPAAPGAYVAPQGARTSPGVFGPPRAEGSVERAPSRPTTRHATPRYPTDGVPAARPQYRAQPAAPVRQAPQVYSAPAARQRVAPPADRSVPPPAQPQRPSAPQQRSTSPQASIPAAQAKEPPAAESSSMPSPQSRGGARIR